MFTSVDVLSLIYKQTMFLISVAAVTFLSLFTFSRVNGFTDEIQIASQKIAASLTHSMSKEAQYIRVKRASKYSF